MRNEIDMDREHQTKLNEKILASLDEIKTTLIRYSIYVTLLVSGAGILFSSWDKIKHLFI